MIRSFWTELGSITPVFQIVDHCPLSLVPVSYSLILYFIINHLDAPVHSILTRYLKKRLNVIFSEAHILAINLDTMVSTDRFSDFSRLLDGRPVISIAQSALQRDLEFAVVPGHTLKETIR